MTMSRSYRKTPIFKDPAHSDKWYKTLGNRRLRHYNKQALITDKDVLDNSNALIDEYELDEDKFYITNDIAEDHPYWAERHYKKCFRK
jgi:hypothetical protein